MVGGEGAHRARRVAQQHHATPGRGRESHRSATIGPGTQPTRVPPGDGAGVAPVTVTGCIR